MESEKDSAGDRLENAQLVRSLSCRRCGYNLRGLRVAGQCPECGFSIWETLQNAVDPAASRLPRMHNPARVGDALAALVLVLIAATLLMLARPVALRLDAMIFPQAATIALWTPPWLSPLAGGVILLGLAAVRALAPPRGAEPGGLVWRDIHRLGAGLTIWGGMAVAAWLVRVSTGDVGIGGPAGRVVEQAIGHLFFVLAVILTMTGLRGVLRVIGERSREYRTARGGRQRLRDMIAAAIGIAAGELLRLLALTFESDRLNAIGTVFVWICTLMLVIGLAYLLVNAWWIRRALRRPPPTLRELLEEAGEDERPAGPGIDAP